jgi:hypothetical protein
MNIPTPHAEPSLADRMIPQRENAIHLVSPHIEEMSTSRTTKSANTGFIIHIKSSSHLNIFLRSPLACETYASIIPGTCRA